MHHNKDLTCSVHVIDIGEERGLTIHFRLPPLVVPPWPVPHCMRSWPRSGTQPTSSRTQQVHSSLDVHIHGHVLSRHTQLVYRPAGRDLEHHASRYTCGFRKEKRKKKNRKKKNEKKRKKKKRKQKKKKKKKKKNKTKQKKMKYDNGCAGVSGSRHTLQTLTTCERIIVGQSA